MSKKPDYSWYAGEVDHEAVKQIVRLKRRGEILKSYKHRISDRDLKLIDRLSSKLDADLLRECFARLKAQEDKQ